MKNKLIWLISLILIAGLDTRAQTNPGFEEGLSGWEPTEQTTSVKIVTDNIYQGNASVRLGNENAEIIQRISLPQLCLFYYNTHIKSSDKNTIGYSFVRFYDKNDHLLIEYKNKPISSITYQTSSYYTESPALTQYATIGVKKSNGKGYIYADDFSIKTRFGEPENKPQATVNLDQYMKPFWKTDTIYNETILLYSINGQPANGRLLFQPDKIISVKSFDLKTAYANAKDYDLKGNVITRIDKSDIPYRADTSFSHKNFAWFNIQSQWIAVTYTHHDKWDGVKPEYKGDDMPNTLAKLKSKTPMTIVAYGMSITRGMNVSGYDMKVPYMPSYVDLFTRALKEKYHENIKLYNAGLPGSKIDWGAEYTDEYVNALKPDLVIIDFGMNDFSGFTSEQFMEYAKTIINKLKAANPKVEIMLLSNMKFDPEYIAMSDPKRDFCLNNMIAYNKVFQSFQTKGIINLDMTDISEMLFDKKKPKDCISNPLHPNDYMARWYAQGMAALLIKD
jgi:lysophospholipase L1-like esterase